MFNIKEYRQRPERKIRDAELRKQSRAIYARHKQISEPGTKAYSNKKYYESHKEYFRQYGQEYRKLIKAYNDKQRSKISLR